MNTLASDPRFRTYALCCIVLTLQMLTLGAVTAARRAKHKGYMNPEDKAVSSKDATLVDGEHPDVARVQRAHRNLLESLPLFFALGLVAVLAGASSTGVQLCFGAFTGARVLHSVVYVSAVQPWRTVAFGIGTSALVALSVLTLLALYG